MRETPSEAARRHIAELAALPSTIPHEQKLCDAKDWHDPRINYVIRHVLRQNPFLFSRQWQHAHVYSILARRNRLGADRRGISFGAGREPLTYAVANAVDHLLATDLYDPESTWRTARTADPAAFLLAEPSLPVDLARLEVKRMDMRAIDAPEGAFDFAYSICAFEHIGTDPDFVRHLTGVRRILKPGGVYVMTTELRLGPRSHPIETNYAFSIEHLLSLCQAAGLQPEPIFDGSLSDSGLNWPCTASDALHHDPLFLKHAGKICNSPVIVREYGGIIAAACCLVLTPSASLSKAACNVIGLEETILTAARRAAAAVAHRYVEWTRLNPAAFFADHRCPYCAIDAAGSDSRPPGDLMFCSSYMAFGGRRMKCRITVVASESPRLTLPAGIDLVVNEWSHADVSKIVPIVIRRQQLADAGQRLIEDEFEFATRPDHCYAIFALRAAGDLRINHADIAVRFAD